MDKSIDVQAYEAVLNEILPGLTNCVRDANLSLDVVAKYVPGMIIRNPAFTDASCRVMGMVTTHRYAILTNHMADLSRYEHGTNWGLVVAQADAHFKVLDVFSYNGKTQILLLHLPDDDRWRMFENMSFNLEEQLIADCRERFKAKCCADVIPELATQEWLSRCDFPLGIDPRGDLFQP